MQTRIINHIPLLHPLSFVSIIPTVRKNQPGLNAILSYFVLQ